MTREQGGKEEADHDKGPEGADQEISLLLLILGRLWDGNRFLYRCMKFQHMRHRRDGRREIAGKSQYLIDMIQRRYRRGCPRLERRSGAILANFAHTRPSALAGCPAGEANPATRLRHGVSLELGVLGEVKGGMRRGVRGRREGQTILSLFCFSPSSLLLSCCICVATMTPMIAKATAKRCTHASTQYTECARVRRRATDRVRGQ